MVVEKTNFNNGYCIVTSREEIKGAERDKEALDK